MHNCIVDEYARGMENLGGVVTTEVTFEYQGKRARFDIVASSNGVPVGVSEIKTFLDFVSTDSLVRNQSFVSQGIRNGSATPVGDNAKSAGFTVGKRLGRRMWVHVFSALVSKCGG